MTEKLETEEEGGEEGEDISETGPKKLATDEDAAQQHRDQTGAEQLPTLNVEG